MAQSKDFTNMVKNLKEDYTKQGFEKALKEETLEGLEAKKPSKAAKKGTLKEKKDQMNKLLESVSILIFYY